MNGKILSIRTKGKSTILVEITVLLHDNKVKYVVSEGTYRKIGCPLSGEIINGDSLEALSCEDEERRALIKALSILSYADNNMRRLYSKLITHGFSKDVAKKTVEECVRLGYIDEERQLERLITKYSEELLGPKKIMAKLAQKSYSPAEISRMIRLLEDAGKLDFKKTRATLLKTKLTDGASYDEMRKLLHKYGYTK